MKPAATFLFPVQEDSTRHNHEHAQLVLGIRGTTHLSITEVAFIAGFSSQLALGNAFKKEFFCSPGSIRRGR